MMRLPTRQRGIALPIMLIMLTVMLVSSIYLLKSSTSTTLTTSNLAYDASLSKAADLGVHTAFAYLRSMTNASLLEVNQPANGYVATLTPTWTASTPAFWNGSVLLAADPSGNRVEYVIHRLCDFAGAFNAPGNRCLLTSARPNSKSKVPYGKSGRADSPNYLDQPQLHYVVTARIVGARGGNVVTQAVVMKGP
ncbi:pilus assembly PilX family protein [Duganella sp. S19_KUP01_CR8]|uniref:pilus assembly PilX family protein n=1 Tax=Duganella sp. S19_KUP01_CR8 TaxID=3025502 RepID=UPI002FCD7123